MRTWSAVLGLTTALAATAFAWGLDGGPTLGLPGMAYLNGQLAALAQREGTEAARLRLAWGAEAVLWPWGPVGLGLEFLSASGGIRGREFTPQTCWVLGLSLRGRLEFPLFGRALSLQAGVGAYRAGASGLFSGSGFALGGDLRAGGPLLSWGGLGLSWWVGFRYLPVATIQGDRGRIAPAGLPALDFSGLYLGIDFAWEG